MNHSIIENKDRTILNEIRQRLHDEVEMTPGHMAEERGRLMLRLIREEADALPARGWTMMAFAGVLGAVIAVAVLVPARFLHGEPPIAESSVLPLVGYWHVEPGDRISSGQLIRVPSDEGAKVAFADDTTLWLDSGTELKYSTHAIHLETGCILASVTSQRPGTDFRIKTSLGTVVVHGTTFTICTANSVMRVALYQGEISINSDTSPRTVIPGQYVEFRRGGVPATRSIESGDGRDTLDFLQKCANLPGRPIPRQLLSKVWTNNEETDNRSLIKPAGKITDRKAMVARGENNNALVRASTSTSTIIVADAGTEEVLPFYVPDGILVESGEAEELLVDEPDGNANRFPTPEEAAETMRINATQELLKLFPSTETQR